MHSAIELKRVLQKEQMRYTSQRQAVWDELCSTNMHRNAEDIYFSLRKEGVSVSRATVYRTIDVLVKHNLVRKLDLGDGHSRFEHKLDPHHHDHLICIKCGKIVEFVDDGIEKTQERVATKYGMKLVRHTHQLFGLCNECID